MNLNMYRKRPPPRWKRQQSAEISRYTNFIGDIKPEKRKQNSDALFRIGCASDLYLNTTMDTAYVFLVSWCNTPRYSPFITQANFLFKFYIVPFSFRLQMTWIFFFYEIEILHWFFKLNVISVAYRKTSAKIMKCTSNKILKFTFNSRKKIA